MEVENDGSLPFVVVELLNLAPRIKTRFILNQRTLVLLHYQSHVDSRYRRCLITTMLDRAYRLSSGWSYFSQECDRLKDLFFKLKYPKHLLSLAVKQFLVFNVSNQQNISCSHDKMNAVRVILPFKDQDSANFFEQRLSNLSAKINSVMQPVCISRQLIKDIRVREFKPAIVN